MSWSARSAAEHVLQIMRASGDALDYLRRVSDVRWTMISPAALIAHGSRTGTYRGALDDLVVGEDGQSRVSTEDFAVAVADEIEHPQHVNERSTVGY